MSAPRSRRPDDHRDTSTESLSRPQADQEQSAVRPPRLPWRSANSTAITILMDGPLDQPAAMQ